MFDPSTDPTYLAARRYQMAAAALAWWQKQLSEAYSRLDLAEKEEQDALAAMRVAGSPQAVTP